MSARELHHGEERLDRVRLDVAVGVAERHCSPGVREADLERMTLLAGR